MSTESRVLRTHLEKDAATAVLTVGGEVDAASVTLLRAGIEEALDGEPELLVLDLSDVGFFGSAGLSALLFALEAVPRRELRVVASPQVRRPIEVTGLDQVLIVFDTLDDALSPDEDPSIV
ncbi:STAS domain-containing protein [Nocardia brasiliensis]|uniref:STAS domain-containing protein n=1 Tax=Nocardia brasiliensis TaxID=37326 RepID=UPI002453B3F6|nr:STAS domain-containing protein [Nocardia brasiliensis]